MPSETVTFDPVRSAGRIEQDIETLAGPDFTRSDEAVRRYAYTPEYRATLDYFVRGLEELGFEISYDPVGTLVARNRPPGEKVFGIGSHCDSNRNGGKYDGTMGVVTALEVCRLNAELGLDLPLQLISFLEEEGSGFGQMLLGSRITAQRVTEEELREDFRAIDDGRSFWEHAEAAGYEPSRWQEAIHVLDDLTGWIELHIEQARVLQDTGNRIGIVNAIAGYIHADIWLEGRADHAGATPMDFRLDAAPAAARVIVEVERLAREVGGGTVGTVGEIEFEPGLINVVPGKARLSLDTRGVDEAGFRSVSEAVEAFVQQVARETGLEATFRQRQTLPATPMDAGIVGALEAAAEASGEPFMTMPSGAAHDTMCVADVVPTAMVFVPCRDGISHSPLEDADPADAALGAGIILNAIRSLVCA
jgi:allantoate deiminase